VPPDAPPNSHCVGTFEQLRDVWERRAEIDINQPSVDVQVNLLLANDFPPGNPTFFLDVVPSATPVVTPRPPTHPLITMLTNSCVTINPGWDLCWKFEVERITVNVPDPRVCATWNADFLDSGHGEDDPGVEVPGELYRRYPASHARFVLNVAGPFGQGTAQGYLDRDGCVPTGTVPKEAFMFRAGAQPGTPDGLTLTLATPSIPSPMFGEGGFQRPDPTDPTLSVHYDVNHAEPQQDCVLVGGACDYDYLFFGTAPTSSADNPGDVPLGSWQSVKGIAIPPERIDLGTSEHTAVTNVATVVSSLLAKDDAGIEPGTYRVVQNDGCEFTKGELDSCGSSPELSVGAPVAPPHPSACSVDQDCTGGTQCFQRRIPPTTPGMHVPCDPNLGPCICMLADQPEPPDPRACTVDSQCAGAQICLRETMFPTHPGRRTPCEPGATYPCICTWPDQSAWKFVTAHEAGHQIQHRGIGTFPSTFDYLFDCPPGMSCTGRRSSQPADVAASPDPAGRPLLDPPFVDSMSPLCGCQHVDAANGLHCLQSIERGGGAQIEGFAQFFSSRVWNRQDEADCTFVYYKEMLREEPCTNPSEVCSPFPGPGGPLFSQLPPMPVSCSSGHKWRNRHCPMGENAEMGTELDWLAFLYNLNSGAEMALRSRMDDIWRIYRHACVPPPLDPTNPPAAPPPCSTTYEIGWTSQAPSLPLVPIMSMSPILGSCTSDADCAALGGPIDPTTNTILPYTCRAGTTPDSVEPCTGGACRCKLVRTCTGDAECVAIDISSSCRDATAASPLPCAGGSCICKRNIVCDVTMGCAGGLHCRDDSIEFPPCTDGSCVCVQYERFGFLEGANLAYVTDVARRERVLRLGNDLGVSNDLSP
jgi:hypothetical protein